jgi:acetyl esterase
MMPATRSLLFPALILSACLAPLAHAQTPPKPNAQMKAVLDELGALHGKPIPQLSAKEARKQPTPADAVKMLLKKQGKSTDPEPVGSVRNTTVPGPAGPVPVRIYTPSGEGPFPVIFYIHGGGWVIATMDTYDASPRAMVNLTNAMVVSVEYRKAPEHKFPAAHEDCYAALQYVMKNAGKMKGDPKRVAVMGESAGGNMASAICMMARDRKGMMPIYEALVYPVANGNLNTRSYQINAKAKPLNKPMMAWFFRNTVKSMADAKNPYLAILKGNVKGLPAATVITAEIDPLMSEGKAYADKLKQAGIAVQYRNYTGVTHEFFGMGAVVDKAKDAEMFAADGLKSAFNK